MPTPVEVSIGRLVDILEDVRPDGAGYTARCPAHEDRSPSLSINPGHKGWLVHCYAGCNVIDVLAHAGLRVGDLFYDSGQRHDETATAGLRELVRRTTPVDLRRVERFDDVAWLMWPHRFAQFVEACMHYSDVAELPFPEGMRHWTIIRDGFLYTWLGPNTWPTARNTTARKLWQTYNNQPMTS